MLKHIYCVSDSMLSGTKQIDNLILEKGRDTRVSAPISHTDVYTQIHIHTTDIPQAHTKQTKLNKTKVTKINKKRNKMKTQQNDETIPNKTKSVPAANSASLLIWSFEFKSFRCAVVVPSSKDPGSWSCC